MVQLMVEGLPAHGVPLHHVNLRLSHNIADIGCWRPGKVFAVIVACGRAIATRYRTGCDTLYYVPAPGKRGALWRDLLVMLLCRPFFPRLVLHWHASGLNAWLDTKATAIERSLTRLLLGRADLSVVLADSLRADADALAPHRVAVVPNGIADPGAPRPRPHTPPFQVLFLGLCSEDKGLFIAASAVLAANRAASAANDAPDFTLIAAGPFPDDATAELFKELCRQYPATLRHAGAVNGAEKDTLFRHSHCLCLPTRYSAEGQPLVLLEAMAHDLPVIATRWRAIPATLPPEAMLVEPGDADALVDALIQLRKCPPPAGVFRRHYLDRFTNSRHLDNLAAAFTSVR